jgi:UDP-N-acetylmuramyl pentapeptide phosphotransferase/UDP-N-acetylglucosamine-1-phosphate transferase
MGDVGSLALGAVLAVIAIIVRQESPLEDFLVIFK